MHLRKFSADDWVTYRKLKHSTSPSPRARNISAAPNGEGYDYFIVKFWTVEDVLDDGRLKVRTRRGKTHLIDASDPNLRRIPWWKWWMYKHRFRDIGR
jgi:hypothetical protein